VGKNCNRSSALALSSSASDTWRFNCGQFSKRHSRVWVLYRHHQHLTVLSGETVARLRLVKPRAQSLTHLGRVRVRLLATVGDGSKS